MKRSYKKSDPTVRFMKKVTIDTKTGCWLWHASGISTHGYGRFGYEGKLWNAHRYSYVHIAKKQIPEGMQLDHLCRVRHCVNPAHLEVVSNKENVLRGIGITARNRLKTHCPKGHEYTALNTAYYKSAPTKRHCKECNRMRYPAHYAKTQKERMLCQVSQGL